MKNETVLVKSQFMILHQMLQKKWAKKRRVLFGITKKKLPRPVKNLKELSQAIHAAKEAIEEEDVEKTIDVFDEFIDPTKSGEQMIETFFDEHREIRLWKIRLKDRGQDYLIENKRQDASFI